METIIKTLEKAGLTNKQALVYTSLLKTGQATVAEVATVAGVKRTTVYVVLEELEIMELVFSGSDGKRVMYTARDPKSVLNLMFSRGKLVEEIMPDLSALYTQETRIQTFNTEEQTVEKVRQVINSGLTVMFLLEKNTPGENLLKSLKDTLRENRGKDFKLLFIGLETGLIVENVQTKFIVDSGDQAGLIITESSVFIFPRGKQNTIFVQDESFAKTQKMFFEQIWQTAKTKGQTTTIQFPGQIQ